MAGLAPVSWKEFARFLACIGCTFRRETASHRAWGRAGLSRPIIVPKYPAIPVFVIRNNLRTLGMTIAEYLEILRNL